MVLTWTEDDDDEDDEYEPVQQLTQQDVSVISHVLMYHRLLVQIKVVPWSPPLKPGLFSPTWV